MVITSRTIILSVFLVTIEIGMYTITNIVLGKGSYGTVYLTEGDKTQLATKCCTVTDTGVTNILECYIMNTLRCSSLMAADVIYTSAKTSYIIQPKASGDARNYNTSGLQLKRYCWTLATAVACLHSENIIHGDIKAANVLLFEDQVKLSDFTLSVKSLVADQTFEHTICTITHRPPEVLLKKSWSYAVDIWALACTYFELAYGRLLFPIQVQDYKVTTRYLNAIVSWSKKQGLTTNTVSSRDFVKVTTWSLIDDPEFKDLLLYMLVLDSSKRPTIFEVLEHPYFTGQSPVTYSKAKVTKLRALTVRETVKATQYLETIIVAPEIIATVLDIYETTIELNIRMVEHLETIIYMICKTMNEVPPNMSTAITTLVVIEILILNTLEFRLFT